LAVVGVAHAPRLRHLQIQAAPAPAGSNARPVVVGCRGPHPDLRQLARLAMDPSITLCINLLRYLSSLPGLSLSEGLQRAVDAYLSRRCAPCLAACAARSQMLVCMRQHDAQPRVDRAARTLRLEQAGDVS